MEHGALNFHFGDVHRPVEISRKEISDVPPPPFSMKMFSKLEKSECNRLKHTGFGRNFACGFLEGFPQQKYGPGPLGTSKNENENFQGGGYPRLFSPIKDIVMAWRPPNKTNPWQISWIWPKRYGNGGFGDFRTCGTLCFHRTRTVSKKSLQVGWFW